MDCSPLPESNRLWFFRRRSAIFGILEAGVYNELD
jgi:hypothetical protein